MTSFLYGNMHVMKATSSYAGHKQQQRWHTRVESEGTINVSLPIANKDAYYGFEAQKRHHQKFKTGVSMAPQMKMHLTKFRKKIKTWIAVCPCSRPLSILACSHSGA